MNTIYATYPEAAREEITRRLRAADAERGRRPAGRSFRLSRRARSAATTGATWR